MRISKYSLLLLLNLLVVNVWAEPPLETFAKSLEYHTAILSPDGRNIAVQRLAEESKTTVAIIDAEDLSLKGHIGATTYRSPIRPWWVNNDRLVVEYTQGVKKYETEVRNGEIGAIDANGKKYRDLIRNRGFFRSSTSASSEPDNELFGHASIVRSLPNKKRDMVISLHSSGRLEFFQINTVSGRVKRIAEAPNERSYVTFSPKGEPQFSVGWSIEGGKNTLETHQYKNGKWELLPPTLLEGAQQVSFVARSKDPNEIYIQASYLDKTDRIYRYNLESRDKKLVFAHGSVDPTSFMIDGYTNELIAVHFDDGEPNLHIIDNEHVYAQWYPSLFAAFGGRRVHITSATANGDKMIIHVSGANEPGQFHLFDAKKKSFSYLFNAASWVDAESLSETVPFSMTSRDGVTLHGYLTEPKSAKKPAPLIVMPHGGPHWVRDSWRYDPYVQFLASRGYAVLQVNFRGSGGYGLGFQQAGYREWGRIIQHDIIDATKWAQKQPGVDAKKACIFGASFGGYSALMSPILEPDLFQCAIGHVGVYDMEVLWETGDIPTHNFGENFLQEVIGEDKEEWIEFSPAKRVSELKAPVLLIHGEDDWRAHVEHYYVMKKALEEKNHEHETLLVDKEGHGFANEKNRLLLLQTVEKFLDKHLPI